MSKSIQAPLSEIEHAVKMALYRTPLAASKHLLLVCENGGFDGKRYDSCFFGHLARGTGVEFPSHASGEDHFKVLDKFCRSLGVELSLKKNTQIEAFCLTIGMSDTAETNPELAHIGRWCLEFLNEMLTEQHRTRSLLHRSNATGAEPALV